MDQLEELELRQLDPEQLERVRIDLLDSSFPPAERLTADEIQEIYIEAAEPSPSMVIIDDGRPIAVMLAEWFVNRRVLLLSYLAVDPARRGQRLGGHLVSDVLAGWNGGGQVLTLAEVGDPRFHRVDRDWGDPEARLRFYGRLGADLLPMAYFQPSLRPGSPRMEGMLLLRLAGRLEPPEILQSFLREYFDGCEPGATDNDPATMALLAASLDVGVAGVTWPVERYSGVPRFPLSSQPQAAETGPAPAPVSRWTSARHVESERSI